MKKCPVCKSISRDEDTTYGVCGASLEHVYPMVETLDQSALEDMAEGKAAERQFAQKARELNATKVAVGLATGLAVLVSGLVLITYNGFGSWRWSAVGFLFLPLGLWITASVALGGLGPSGSYRLRSYRYLWFWWGWIGSRDKEEEGSERAESVGATEENDRTEEERRKGGFN